MTIRIDGTNTAANPGITGTDTDTGLQFGTDEVNIVTGGSTRATVDSSGNFHFNSGYGSVATAYGCRAWINFNGGEATIGDGRENGNMDAVTDNGTGDYTVNFTNDMPDANYAVAAAYGTTAGSISTREYNVGDCTIRTYNTSDALIDRSFVCITIFR